MILVAIFYYAMGVLGGLAMLVVTVPSIWEASSIGSFLLMSFFAIGSVGIIFVFACKIYETLDL